MKLFEKSRVEDEHVIRPQLISIARDRIFEEATKQLFLCKKLKCNGGTGKCDDSCVEAKAFITGKSIHEVNRDAESD